MSKLIVRNVFQSFQCGSDTSGLGDFLRGCLSLHNLSIKLDFNFEINIKSNNQLYSLIETKSEWIKPDPQNLFACIRDQKEIETKIQNAKANNDIELNLFTTIYPFNIEDRSYRFLIEHFKPKKILADYIEEFLSKKNLIKYNYEIIQIRLSDLLFIDPNYNISINLLDLISNELKRIILKKHNYIITSTYQNLLEKLNLSKIDYPNLFSTNIKDTVHLGKVDDKISIDIVKDTCLEFFLSFYANRITCLNHYYWASNFTRWIALVNRIDYNYIQMNEVIKPTETEFIKRLSGLSLIYNNGFSNPTQIKYQQNYRIKIYDDLNKYEVFRKADIKNETDMYNSFQIDGYNYQRMLFFDCFIKNEELILIGQVYHNLKINYQTDVTIKFNNNINIPFKEQIVPFESGSIDTPEAYNIIKYSLPSNINKKDSNKFLIQYKNQAYIYNLIPVKNIKTEFTIATLFKDDYYQIPLFYNYYKKQGVTKFIFYYNGNINRVYELLFKAPEIEYYSWNFDYYMDEVTSWENSNEFKKKYNTSNIHHAQTAFLSMVRYKYFEDTTYLLLNDLDEFLHVPGENLINYLRRTNKEMYQVKNYWAKLNNRIPDDKNISNKFNFSIESLRSITAEKNPSKYNIAPYNFFDRTKMIYRNDAKLNYQGKKHTIDSFNIHMPRPYQSDIYSLSCSLLDNTIKMYQFINLDDRDRENLWSKDPKDTLNLLM